MVDSADGVPVISRLSQLLVAFTLEVDHEFEHRMPHRTSADRGTAAATRGPWLVSWVTWANYLRLVPSEGIPLRKLAGPYGVPKLSGLQRWGYLTVEPGPSGAPPKAGDWLVTPTRWGREAGQVWAELPGEVEGRWRERLGGALVDELRAALMPLADPSLPRFLPLLGFGLTARTATPLPGPPSRRPDLSALLSWVVGRWVVDYEAAAPLSAALTVDVLRLLDEKGVPRGDLPALGGVPREAVAIAVNYLESIGLASVGRARDGGRVTLVRLSAKGSGVRDECAQVAADLGERWEVDRLRSVVSDVVDHRDEVAGGLRPYADGWRWSTPYRHQTEAFLRDPFGTLPHHPMVLHRGGYPDGS